MPTQRRVNAIIDQLIKNYPRGTMTYASQRYGWAAKGSSPEDGSVSLHCVDYSLQDIGGPDAEVVVFPDDFSWTLGFESGTLPPLTQLPLSKTVINFRFIEGLTDDATNQG